MENPWIFYNILKVIFVTVPVIKSSRLLTQELIDPYPGIHSRQTSNFEHRKMVSAVPIYPVVV